MIIELVKFIICSILIVIIAKKILSNTLRKLAEIMKLKPKTVGYIAGISTSIPELLSVGIAGFSGLIDTGIFNILTSNIINFIEYFITIILNKNIKIIKNKAIILELILVIITIAIPLISSNQNIDLNMNIVYCFIGLYIIFHYINKYIHKKYLKVEDEIFSKEIHEEENTQEKGKSKYYILTIIVSTVLLFFIGNILSNSLEKLCNNFGISQFIIGILLGIITSAPEFITFNDAQRYYKKKYNKPLLGVIEATNNLISSNVINLFVIQSLGILIYIIKFWKIIKR